MNDVVFTATAIKDYMEWQTTDKRTAARINALIKDILRNGFMSGIGKPEALRTRKAYSRRIDDYNRLIYEADKNQNLRIVSCKGHYED
ncbi:MAG: Txe/YoeB family addiction module toxin [Synergistaceae bacterium]|jgi:toxin YoeB|nr:Txe/YoeB family addiction module toxin [Synergistaceae bacterium]